MKMTVSACLMTALLASPAMAWNQDQAQHQHQAQQQRQHQSQTATGGSAKATGGNASATSGNSSASTGAITSAGGTGGNVSIGAIGNGGGNTGGSRAPDVVLPSFGGGGMDCPTVGFGAAGSGLGGGGGFGPSWISSDCNNRKLAELLWSTGHHDAAIALLQNEFPQVQKALAGEPAPSTAPTWTPAAWCSTASRAEQERHYKDCFTE